MARKLTASEAAQQVLDKGYYGVPASRRIDATSARAVLAVAEKLNETNRAKLDAMPVRRAAAVAWVLIGRS